MTQLLKTRAWDSFRNIMIDDYSIFSNGSINRATSVEKYDPIVLKKLEKIEGVGDYYIIDCSDWYANDNYEVMYEIGLYDNYDIPIYSKDIVNFCKGIGFIDWSFENAAFVIFHYYIHPISNKRIIVRYPFNKEITDDIEVIGNVYEDGKLFEDVMFVRKINRKKNISK